MIWSIIMSFAASFVALGVFFYYFRRGSFNDIEEVKYHVFRDGSDDTTQKENN